MIRTATINRGGRPRTNPSPTAPRIGLRQAHQKLRARWAPLVATGMVRCAIGGELLKPGTKWHLAHADHPDAHRLGLYAGPACARHNNGTNRRQLRSSPKPNALELTPSIRPIRPLAQLRASRFAGAHD